MFEDENIIELKVDDSNIKRAGIYPAQSSTWKTSSTNKLKYLEIRSINSADGVLSPRSILPTVLVLNPIAVVRSS